MYIFLSFIETVNLPCVSSLARLPHGTFFIDSFFSLRSRRVLRRGNESSYGPLQKSLLMKGACATK